MQVRNVAAASDAALRQDCAALAAEAGKLARELEEVLGQFDEVQAEADAVEHEVVDEVRADSLWHGDGLHELWMCMWGTPTCCLDLDPHHHALRGDRQMQCSMQCTCMVLVMCSVACHGCN